jgi:DNA polymerase-3 subunit beta
MNVIEAILASDNVVALYPAPNIDEAVTESAPANAPAHAGGTDAIPDGESSATLEAAAEESDADEAIAAELPAPVVPAILQVSRDAFAAAMVACTRAVEKRNTIPVLGNVLIAGTEHGLRITGTDLDLAISADVFAEGDSHFAATLPAHLLSDVLKKAKKSESIILSYEDSAKVSLLLGNRLSVDLQSLPATDFPTFAFGAVTHSAVMPTADLLRAFQKVEFAISTEETRYYLNGVYVYSKDREGKLVFVATDGHRMGIAELPLPADLAGMPGHIIPRATVKQFLALAKAKGAPDTVVFDVHGTKYVEDADGHTVGGVGPRLSFKIGDITLATKPIDGTFPDYARVVPAGNESTMRVNGAELDEAISQVMCISSERGRAVRLSITESMLRLTVANPDSGKATSDVECEFDVPGSISPVLDIGFNAVHMRDILSHIESEAVEFKLADPGSPTLIRGAGDGDNGVTYILMPIRV